MPGTTWNIVHGHNKGQSEWTGSDCNRSIMCRLGEYNSNKMRVWEMWEKIGFARFARSHHRRNAQAKHVWKLHAGKLLRIWPQILWLRGSLLALDTIWRRLCCSKWLAQRPFSVMRCYSSPSLLQYFRIHESGRSRSPNTRKRRRPTGGISETSPKTK